MNKTIEDFKTTLERLVQMRNTALNSNNIAEFHFLAGQVDVLKDVIQKLEK